MPTNYKISSFCDWLKDNSRQCLKCAATVEQIQRRLSSVRSFFPDVCWRAFDPSQNQHSTVQTFMKHFLFTYPGSLMSRMRLGRKSFWNIRFTRLLDDGFELGAAAEGEDEEGEEDMDHQELQRHKERLEREQWIRAQVHVRAWSRGHFNCLMFFSL